MGAKAFARSEGEPNYLGNLTELSQFIDESKYLHKGSDIVALMVLEHQAHMHNYITRLNFRTQMMMSMYRHIGYSRHQQDAFLRYLLFTEEASLTASLKGNPEFTAAFQKAGPRDAQGRSLRDLDLQTRLFKYPVQVPHPFGRVREAAASDEGGTASPVARDSHRRGFSPAFAKIAAGDRQAIYRNSTGDAARPARLLAREWRR